MPNIIKVFPFKWIVTILTIFVVGCSSKKREGNDISKREVKKITILLRSDSTRKIAVPSWIESVSGGFLLYDLDLHKISRFNSTGHKIFSFGRKGRGPGEFQNVGGVWQFDDQYVVYDINSRKLIEYNHTGKPLKDEPLDFVDFPAGPVSVEAISPTQFVMPTGGENESLFRLVDTKTENISYFGEPLIDKKVFIQSSGEQRQAISTGHIPAMYKNKVLLAANQTGIFSFQQITGKLEKFTRSGRLIWQKKLKIPAMDGLFDKLMNKNRKRVNHGKYVLPFIYANGIAADTKGVAILLNLLNRQPVKIIWISNNGQKMTEVTFRNLKSSRQAPPRFTISTNGKHIFFVNTLEGRVYKANWPL